MGLPMLAFSLTLMVVGDVVLLHGALEEGRAGWCCGVALEQGWWGKAGCSCRLVHAGVSALLRVVQLHLILVLAAPCGSGQGLVRGSVPVLGFWHRLSWLRLSAGEWLVSGQTSAS